MSKTDPIDRIIDIATGETEVEPTDVEQRGNRRVDYDSPVAFVQWTPNGGLSIPTIVGCKNISSSGMCIISRYMLHVGHEGAVLIHRSNGEQAMLGVKVVHCAYVGDMKHESGLAFTKAPANFKLEDFRDEHGNMPQLGRRRAA